MRKMTNFKINLTDILKSNLIERKKYSIRYLTDRICNMDEDNIFAFKLNIDNDIIYGNIIFTNNKWCIDFCRSAVLAKTDADKIYIHRGRLTTESLAVIIKRLNAINCKYKIDKGIIYIIDINYRSIVSLISVLFNAIVKIGKPKFPIDPYPASVIKKDISLFSEIAMVPINKNTTSGDIFKFVFDKHKTKTLIRMSVGDEKNIALVINRYK